MTKSDGSARPSDKEIVESVAGRIVDVDREHKAITATIQESFMADCESRGVRDVSFVGWEIDDAEVSPVLILHYIKLSEDGDDDGPCPEIFSVRQSLYLFLSQS